MDTTNDHGEVIYRLLLPFSLLFVGMQVAGLIWKLASGFQALLAWLLAV